jgi:uncharacterized RDD family membrane protein YckC
MPFCVKCGRQIADDARFCPSCGAPVAAKAASSGPAPGQPFGSTHVSGIDALTKDQMVQGYWMRRLIAFVIDAIVVGIAFGILAAILVIPSIITSLTSGNVFNVGAIFGASAYSLLNSVVLVLYFSLAESFYGITLGKSVIRLKATTLEGRTPTLEQSLIRNASKINWVLLLLDVIFGLATQTDYKQKYSDRYARTVVVGR